jgi:hypothetical protein
MNKIQLQEQEQYEEIIKKRISSAFPNANTVEDNLKPGKRVYTFNTECYRDTGKAILIFHNIWLPKSQIKIKWGDLQEDFIIDVKLSVPKWLIKKTLLNDYLKVD